MTEEEIQMVQEMIEDAKFSTLHQSQIPPQTIKKRHLEDKVIVFGSGNRPTDDTTGISVHFDTGTGVLSMWSGTAWLTTTLT